MELTDFEVVEQLLLSFRDAREAGTRNGNRADRHSSVALLMGEWWWEEESFAALERYLAGMRRYRLDVEFGGYSVFELRRHVDWWYVDAVRKPVENMRSEKCRGGACRHCRGGKRPVNGQHSWGTGTFSFRLVRDRRADRVRAEVGVRYLLSRFKVERLAPRLPDELWRIVQGLPERAA